MNDIRIVVGILLGAVLFPYLTIMLAIMRYERRSCRKMEEAMLKEKYTKHGHWIQGYDYIQGIEEICEFPYIECSECGYKEPSFDMNEDYVDIDDLPKYCAECGAKMDDEPDPDPNNAQAEEENMELAKKWAKEHEGRVKKYG